jgi:hypothetical protein
MLDNRLETRRRALDPLSARRQAIIAMGGPVALLENAG